MELCGLGNERALICPILYCTWTLIHMIIRISLLQFVDTDNEYAFLLLLSRIKVQPFSFVKAGLLEVINDG